MARNLLAKVPKKLEKAVADNMPPILYAFSKKKAMEFSDTFKEKWQSGSTFALICLDNSLKG